MSGPGSEFQYHQLNSKKPNLQETVDAGQLKINWSLLENSICDSVSGIHADEQLIQ